METVNKKSFGTKIQLSPFIVSHHNLSTIYREIIKSGSTAGLTLSKEESLWKILVWGFVFKVAGRRESIILTEKNLTREKSEYGDSI